MYKFTLNSYIILLFVLVLILSCSKVDIKNDMNSSKFFIETIALTLDDSTSNEFYRVQYVHEFGNDFLFVLNSLTKSLDVYDLRSGNLNKRIYYPVDGPNGISSIVQGFYYHNDDSIFLFPQGRLNGSLLLDIKGDVKSVIKPPAIETEKFGIINHVSTSANPSFFHNNMIYLSRYPLFDLQNPSNINSTYPLGVKYDLTKNLILMDSTIVYPEFYMNNIWSTFDLTFSRVFDGESFIFSWPLLDQLLKIKYGGNEVESYLAKSKKDNSKSKPFSMRPSDKMEDEVSLSNLRYGEILYDEYSRLYYRIVYHPLKHYTNETFPTHRQARDFSVLVLDKNFNLLQEVSFPGKKYLVFNAFVGPKGLYLTRNNPFYDELNEDLVYIDIFSFRLNE